MKELPPELRQLFADEAATRLNRLSEELVTLESESAAVPDPELVASVFRDAHTLKGSAGMMGFTPFANVAHRMEDLLDEVRSGNRPPSTALVDALLRAVDGLRVNLGPMLDGTVDNAVFTQLEEHLRHVDDAPAAPEPEPEPSKPKSKATTGAVARVPVARLEALHRLAGEASVAHARLVSTLADDLPPGAALPSDSRVLGTVLRELEERAGEARMAPFGTVMEPLRRAVRDLAHSQGKAVRIETEGTETELGRGVLDVLADALLHLVRNAVDHGIESSVERVAARKKAQAVVRITAAHAGRDVVVTLSDDGRGIDLDRVRATAGLAPEVADADALDLLFQPGFSTAATVTTVSGRGVGLDVVRSSLASVQGRVTVRSERGQGTTFTVIVPLTIAAVPCLVVQQGGHRYALALTAVRGTGPPRADDVSLATALKVPGGTPTASVTVTGHGGDRTFAVDGVVGQRDVVVKSLGALPHIPMVAGAGIDTDGSVLVVLEPSVLLGQPVGDAVPMPAEPLPAEPAPSPRILVVDDAIVAREIESALLRREGYEVRVAKDGAEALQVLRSWPADLALVDVEMPVMNGLELTEAIRADPVLRGTAVLMLTALGSSEDQRRGMEAGADGYVVKGTYTPDSLMAAVARLLGRSP
jgi:two-component system chemotaxis sensor kinase CheA